MLPEPQYRPASLLQVGVGLAVTLDVAGDLVGPVLAVGGGLGAVLGAAVPVAAVYDRDTSYSRAASAWVRPSTTTAVITRRAFDMTHIRGHHEGSHVLHHQVPMS